MIREVDLFGRQAISPRERHVLNAARTTAISLYNKRSIEPYKSDFLDNHVGELTFNDVENYVIEMVREREKLIKA